MSYFLGGYYLTKLRRLDFGSKHGQTVYTGSDCINDNLLGDWAYSWSVSRKAKKEAKKTFQLTDSDLDKICEWVDAKDVEKLVGWVNQFNSQEIALEYQNLFFPHISDTHLFGLYFDETASAEIVEEFKPESEKYGEIGLYQNLLKRIPEEDRPGESLIGFDLIGIEVGGSFHSFHCHDIGEELSNRFGLELNEYGLFNPHDNWEPVLSYLNDDANGCEPVPWFVAKTKLVIPVRYVVNP
jgi:hypothetical protein